jgi:hypothetical protein
VSPVVDVLPLPLPLLLEPPLSGCEKGRGASDILDLVVPGAIRGEVPAWRSQDSARERVIMSEINCLGVVGNAPNQVCTTFFFFSESSRYHSLQRQRQEIERENFFPILMRDKWMLIILIL